MAKGQSRPRTPLEPAAAKAEVVRKSASRMRVRVQVPPSAPNALLRHPGPCQGWGRGLEIPSPAPNFSCVGPGHRSGWFCERVRSAAASTTLVDQALVSSRGCLCLRTCIRLHRALTANEDSPDLISPPAARAPISGRARCDLRHALAGAGSSRLKRHRPHGLADRPDKAEHLSGLWAQPPAADFSDMLGFISLAQKYRRFLGNAQLTSILARTLRRCLQPFRTIGRLFYRRPALQTHADCFVPLERRVADKRSAEAEVIPLTACAE